MKNMVNNVTKNTAMLYLMNIAKLIFPLMTLPYLTRVLSVDAYGVVAYVKSVMTYMQILVDFGFVLSSTKGIVEANGDMKKIGAIVGESIAAKLLLCCAGILILAVMSVTMPILKAYTVYTFLSFAVVVLSSFLMDYLFRGLEKMHILTIRFVIMKGISTILTFVFVRGDESLLWIPALDVISSLVAVVLSVHEAKKIGVIFSVKLKRILECLKESFLYFCSQMATTVFSAFTTIVIGYFMSTADVAYWSVVMQIVSAVQAMYSPIADGIYPEMVRSKSLALVKKLFLYITPVLLAGTVLAVVLAKYVMLVIGGEKYVAATNVLRTVAPIFPMTFYVYIFGWPMLGAINRVKENTITTVSYAVFAIVGLMALALSGKLNLINLAVFRWVTELFLLLMRAGFCFKFRNEFNK